MEILSPKRSQSSYVKKRVAQDIDLHSNGETALRYFLERIDEDAIYLLDEPENSLSPRLQRELADFLADSARFYGCQFVISTHSPFLLAMKEAKVYDLDSVPVREKRWTELENVRDYYDFFKSHEREF
jgi:predicted ATPase